MKIQIDTKAKTATIEEAINIKEFMDFIEKLLPDWKSYKLEMKAIERWSNPITVPYYPTTPCLRQGCV